MNGLKKIIIFDILNNVPYIIILYSVLFNESSISTVGVCGSKNIEKCKQLKKCYEKYSILTNQKNSKISPNQITNISIHIKINII